MVDLILRPQTDHLIRNQVLMTYAVNKDSQSRLGRYVSYLEQQGSIWFQDIDLGAYRDYLRSAGLAESSIQAHLSTVRSAYRKIARNRQMFYAILNTVVQNDSGGPGNHELMPADAKAMVDEIIVRIENAIHPDQAPTRTTTIQDHTDRQQIRLSVKEVKILIALPEKTFGKGEPSALRDAALLSLLATTGIREAEAVALNVADIRQYVGGEISLLVREGKGNKQRAIPYGELVSGLQAVERWLDYVGQQVEIEDTTPVFWSFWKDRWTLRSRLSTRRVGEIIRSYWIERDGEMITVAPHDLRRTYARLQYEAGMGILEISQNMGHTSVDMTKRYIGPVDMKRRRNKKAF